MAGSYSTGIGAIAPFRVTRGAGLVGAGTDRADRGVIATTDADGIARTQFKVGRRVGVGNHKVRARVVGYDDQILFHAGGEGAMADKLSVNSGNNQRGGVFQRLPSPFVVVATDMGANVVEGASVKFEVTEGGGQFPNGEQTVTKTTDGDGRASAHLALGGKTGLDQQRVKATLLDGPEGEEITSVFTASGFEPGPAGDTSISGVVVNNQDKPLPGVTVRVEGTSRKAVADEQGQFTIDNVPVGPVHLIADGSTAEAQGDYPDLAYNLTTVSGVDNPLPDPIYMVKLNPETKAYAGKEDVTLTLPEVPGFKLEIPAGSVTFPDGSREGYVSVTAVNANHVPMTPPNGMQPQFIVTIQPTGAKFDPPAKLTLPNVDGHKPGAQVEMYSFDHDLEEFVSVGLGTVSEDGTTITSNPGVGVVKAGWHCGSQPGESGNCCSDPDCNECEKVEDCACVPDEKPECTECEEFTDCEKGCEAIEGKEKSDQPSERDCTNHMCDGTTEADESETKKDEPGDCQKPVCDGENPTTENDDTDNPECKKCEDGEPKKDPGKNGDDCEDGCGVCKDGKCEVDDDKPKPADQQSDSDCKTLLCGGGHDDKDSEDPGECEECINGEPSPLDSGESCGDASTDIAGDCRDPGCKNGSCNPKANPDSSEDPDEDPYDCTRAFCSIDGKIQKEKRDTVKNESGKCMFCTDSGKVDKCKKRFDEELQNLENDFVKKVNDCHGVTPADVERGKVTKRKSLRKFVAEGSLGLACTTMVASDTNNMVDSLEDKRDDCHANCTLF